MAPPKYTTWVRVLENVDDEMESASKDLGYSMLKLRMGDVIKVEQRINRTDYWLGSNGSDTGLFPLDERLAPVIHSQVRALYDYTPTDTEEIPFQCGQIMDVVTQQSNWWIWGSYDGTSESDETKRFSGVVPFNFVEPVPPDGEVDNPEPSRDPSEAKVKQYPKWEEVPPFRVRVIWDYKAQSERELNLVADELVLVTQVWGNSWYQGWKEFRSGTFSVNYVTKDLSIPIRATRPPYHRYYVRAEYSYEATAPNEINIFYGEVIEVLWITLDGWWEGRSRDGKRRGLFPSNYTRKISDGWRALQTR
ncbi:Sorbin and SH3 domain-containing protein 2 [Serendipita sp. 399]|nr:Sorbin and SH3 domain-containing protein 2 [Serendipita sp. 399]